MTGHDPHPQQQRPRGNLDLHPYEALWGSPVFLLADVGKEQVRSMTFPCQPKKRSSPPWSQWRPCEKAWPSTLSGSKRGILSLPTELYQEASGKIGIFIVDHGNKVTPLQCQQRPHGELDSHSCSALRINPPTLRCQQWASDQPWMSTYTWQ